MSMDQAFSTVSSSILIGEVPSDVFSSPDHMCAFASADGLLNPTDRKSLSGVVTGRSAERRLPGSAIKLFPQGLSERRIHSRMIGVIPILIANRYLIDLLAQELKRRMI